MTEPDLLAGLVRAGLAAADDPDPRNVAALDRIIVLLTANALAAAPGALPGLRHAARVEDGCVLLAERSRAVDPAEAAAGNAAAITASQCDDGLREARGHPGLHAYAAALAAVEQQQGTVADLRRACRVGWEIGARLGLALGPLRSGIHPHGGWGAGAAAAATAAALGQPPETVEAAVATALAVALAGPADTATGGSSAHFLLAGLGTASGMRAAWHVVGGGGIPRNALQHLARVAHDDPPSATGLVLDRRPLIRDAYLKPIGMCAHALTSWTAAVRLPIAPHLEVMEIEVSTYAAAAELSQREPRSLLARRFSIPWAVGCAVTGQAVDTADPRVAALARRTEVLHDPALDDQYPASRPARVQVRLSDGTSQQGFARFHPGDREQPLDAAGLRRTVLALVRDGALAGRL
ncbi:MAG TPA: MmgE/PrpD family protein, partial [Jatrophihabitans sp.]|nr:MmgE/PrpD family protein [Jatrophihabitans sp.]